MKAKKIMYLLLWLIILGGIIVMTAYSGKLYNRIRCKNYSILIQIPESSDTLLFKNDIERIVLSTDSIIGKKYIDIDIHNLENAIKASPFVSAAEVYGNFFGNISITAMQRQPVVRVINQFGEQFYLDSTAFAMPIRLTHPAYVQVANGYISTHYKDAASDSCIQELRNLLHCVCEINKDAFLKAQIAQIYVKENGMYVFNPVFGNHEIMFGKPKDPEKRLRKLKIFYQKGINNEGWETYRLIDLRFENQIVCSK